MKRSKMHRKPNINLITYEVRNTYYFDKNFSKDFLGVRLVLYVWMTGGVTVAMWNEKDVGEYGKLCTLHHMHPIPTDDHLHHSSVSLKALYVQLLVSGNFAIKLCVLSTTEMPE